MKREDVGFPHFQLRAVYRCECDREASPRLHFLLLFLVNIDVLFFSHRLSRMEDGEGEKMFSADPFAREEFAEAGAGVKKRRDQDDARDGRTRGKRCCG